MASRRWRGYTRDLYTRDFVKEGEDYCPQKAIREMCIFSVHNITKDPPFSRLDLISRRNGLRKYCTTHCACVGFCSWDRPLATICACSSSPMRRRSQHAALT